MSLLLCVRGAQVNLDSEAESFNKVYHRIQEAKKVRMDYELGNSEEFYTNGDKGKLVFAVEGGGKVFFDTADVFGVMTDEDSDE